MFEKQKLTLYCDSGHTFVIRTSGFVFDHMIDEKVSKLLREKRHDLHFRTRMNGSSWTQCVYGFKLRPTLWGRLTSLLRK